MKTLISNLLANWKTTSAGLVMIGGSIIHLVFSAINHTASEGVWTASFAAIVGGIGLTFAGDAKPKNGNSNGQPPAQTPNQEPK